MLVREVGSSKARRIHDRHLMKIRKDGLLQGGSVSSANTIDNANDFLVDGNVKSPVPPGGLLSVGGRTISKRDGTTLTTATKKRLNNLIFENPHAYSYLMDDPRAAIYSDRPLQVIKQDWHDSDEGVESIVEWQRLFEAREGQSSLVDLGIGAAYYSKAWGSVLAWVGYVQNEYLNVLGYPDNEMVGRVSLINPILIREIDYDNTTGKVSRLRLPLADGGYKDYTGDELRNFIYFHNMPANEKYGVSRLQGCERWLSGTDDLLELILEIYYNDARPIEHHTIKEDGLTPNQRDAMITDHEDKITETIDEQSRMLVTSDRWNINLKGSNGKVLESSPLLERLNDYLHEGLQKPASFIIGKDTNKATVDVQLEQWQNVQLKANDRAVAHRLYTEIFRRVLLTRNVDLRLTPTVRFEPFSPANALEQALRDEIEAAVFGQERVVQIAEERGYAYDKVRQVPERPPENNREARATIYSSLRGEN